MNVLVTGAGGQLGQCFKKIAGKYPDLDFLFSSSSELDITKKEEDLKKVFASKKIAYCINCAAYTNVEQAETEIEKAYKINAEGPKILAQTCKEFGTVLLHFSTDYVFDGQSSKPYSEEAKTNPINVYGASKLKGEKYISESLAQYFIFRTSWLYSEFGHNFMNTILKKAGEGATLNITTSQKGTPTNANDLAAFILEIIIEKNTSFGLYHFSNLGEATWYDFARAILDFTGKIDKVTLNKSGFFKTKAERPIYSVLDKSNLLKTFKKPVLPWEQSLKQLLQESNS